MSSVAGEGVRRDGVDARLPEEATDTEASERAQVSGHDEAPVGEEANSLRAVERVRRVAPPTASNALRAVRREGPVEPTIWTEAGEAELPATEATYLDDEAVGLNDDIVRPDRRRLRERLVYRRECATAFAEPEVERATWCRGASG